MEITEKTATYQFVEAQRERIARGKNARKWFVRGVLATLVASYVIANMRDDETTEDK